MVEYSQDEVLHSLSQLNKKSRKRVLVDQRSYLLAVFAYKFKLTEHKIADLTGYKRHTVNYNKKIAVQFYNNKDYMSNVYVYAQQFPFDFSLINSPKPQRDVKVELIIGEKMYNKLKASGVILGHKDVRTTIKLLLEKSLKVWEE
jgi:hypothetical protein